MSGSGTTSATAGGRRTCTACPLLCDDILPAAGRYVHACDSGVAAFAAAADGATAASASPRLRDRADLVVFWFCDPHDTHPRFVERFVDPPPAGAARRTIAVGPAPVLAAGPTHEHLALPESAAIDTTRRLQALLAAQNPHDLPAPVDLACETARAAIEAAACVALALWGGWRDRRRAALRSRIPAGRERRPAARGPR
ncbi:MAG: hypothetical protein EBR23_04610 [Planctomycetia bacterium]|nr:hypothetical protein [Planctomycetia bacterium]